MKFARRLAEGRRVFRCDQCGHEVNGQALEHEAHKRSG